MRKQFKLLIILVVIIGLGIGGYFIYKGLYLPSKEIEEREKRSEKAEKSEESLANTELKYTELKYTFMVDKGWPMDLKRIISPYKEKVVRTRQIPEAFDNFSIHIITTETSGEIKHYVHFENKDNTDLKPGDIIKTDSIEDTYPIFGADLIGIYLGQICQEVAEKYIPPGIEKEVKSFIGNYFEKNPMAVNILLAYKK